jgi:hypothetical protein
MFFAHSYNNDFCRNRYAGNEYLLAFHYSHDAALNRLPRRCLAWRKVITAFALGQFQIRQTLSDYTVNRLQKSASIRLFPFVETEGLFVEIPEQVKRFDLDHLQDHAGSPVARGALKQTHYWGHGNAARLDAFLALFGRVHIAGLSSDKGFIGNSLVAVFIYRRLIGQGGSDSQAHAREDACDEARTMASPRNT